MICVCEARRYEKRVGLSRQRAPGKESADGGVWGSLCVGGARSVMRRVLVYPRVYRVRMCVPPQGQKPEAGLFKRPSVRKIVKPKTKAQLEEEAAASLATTVWDMTDR